MKFHQLVWFPQKLKMKDSGNQYLPFGSALGVCGLCTSITAPNPVHTNTNIYSKEGNKGKKFEENLNSHCFIQLNCTLMRVNTL